MPDREFELAVANLSAMLSPRNLSLVITARAAVVYGYTVNYDKRKLRGKTVGGLQLKRIFK